MERRLRYDTVSKTALALTLERKPRRRSCGYWWRSHDPCTVRSLHHGMFAEKPEKHLKELCALAELPAPPEAVAAVNCPGDWLCWRC